MYIYAQCSDIIWCKISWWMNYVIIMSLDIHLANWKLCTWF